MGKEEVRISLKINKTLHLFTAFLDFTDEDNFKPYAKILKLQPQKIRDTALRYNEYYEVCCKLKLIYTSIPEIFWCMFALLQLPCGTEVYLGPLARDHAEVPSARMLLEIPHKAVFFIRQDHCLRRYEQPPWPVEMLLKETVKAILASDEFRGSIATSHLQNLVSNTPQYISAMKIRTWSKFVGLFHIRYHAWELVTYSEEEHRELGLSFLVQAKEVRLIHNKYAPWARRLDASRDHLLSYVASQFAEENQDFQALRFVTPVDSYVRGGSSNFATLHTATLDKLFKSIHENKKPFIYGPAKEDELYCILYTDLHPYQFDRYIHAAPSLILGGMPFRLLRPQT